jgi:hypothetical protein
MRSTIWMIAASFPLLGACSGTQSVRPALQSDLTNGFEGYLYYPTAQFQQTVQTTRLEDDKKRILAVAGGSGSRGCQPVQSTKYVTSADFKHPWIVRYRPGLLEAYKFGVGWSDDGATMKSVNVESTPDQGKTLANVASAVTSLASVAALAREGTPGVASVPQPFCNAGESIVSSARVNPDFPETHGP